VLLIF